MQRNETQWFLIIDYNNVRFTDVKLMSNYVKTKYGLKTILIHPSPTPIDYEIADVVLDLDFKSENFLEQARKALMPYAVDIKGGIPFSDRSIQVGSMLLQSLGLIADDPNLAVAAKSKLEYRRIEQRMEKLCEAQNIFVPDSRLVHNLEDIQEFSRNHPKGFILKPACEGNNRGVLFLNAESDLKAAFNEVRQYSAEGLIVEELIPFQKEFSFDGVGTLCFLTEKISAHGKYPVEEGQIIPARLDSKGREQIMRAGRIANLIVGQKNGAFHNEVKLATDHGRSAVVEPNRRPAGMQIWHLAEKVFKRSFFELWVDYALGCSSIGQEGWNSLQAEGVAAIRMLGSNSDGTLHLPADLSQNGCRDLFEAALRLFIAKNLSRWSFLSDLEWFDFRFHTKSGADVFQVPRDNSHFVAQVCVYSRDKNIPLVEVLNEFNESWKIILSAYLSPKKKLKPFGKKILVLHRIPFSKVKYDQVIDHDKNDVIYLGNEDALNTIPATVRCKKVLRTEDFSRLHSERIERIVALSEYDLLLAAKLRERLAVQGDRVRDAERVRDKVIMKQFVEKAGIRVPRFSDISDVIENREMALRMFLGKVVAKPKSGASSENVMIFESISDLLNKLESRDASVSMIDSDFEVEDFIEGPILHIDGFVQSGKVQTTLASRYLGNCLDYANGEPLGSVQMFDDAGVSAWTQDCVKAVGIANGAFHLEAISSPTGLVFLEIANRCGGAEVVSTFELASGINLYHAHLKTLLCEAVAPCSSKKVRRYYGWFVFPGHQLNTEYCNIQGAEEFKNSSHILKWSELEEHQKLPKAITYQAGQAPVAGTVHGENPVELLHFLNRLFQQVKVLPSEKKKAPMSDTHRGFFTSFVS